MKNSARYYLINNRIKLAYTAGFLFLALSAVMGIVMGSTSVTFSEIIEIFENGTDSVAGRIILYVRLPRTLAALLCGAALAVSGAVIQGVLAKDLLLQALSV